MFFEYVSEYESLSQICIWENAHLSMYDLLPSPDIKGITIKEEEEGEGSAYFSYKTSGDRWVDDWIFFKQKNKK